VAGLDQAFGWEVKYGEARKFQMFKYPRLPATIVGYHKTVITFGGSRK